MMVYMKPILFNGKNRPKLKPLLGLTDYDTGIKQLDKFGLFRN